MDNLSESFWIVVISQIPLAIYTIWSGVKRNKPEIKKLRTESELALSAATEGAGRTLTAAWKRIDELTAWKEDAEAKIDKLEDELKQWRAYASRLVRRLREVAPMEDPPPFETDPKMPRMK